MKLRMPILALILGSFMAIGLGCQSDSTPNPSVPDDPSDVLFEGDKEEPLIDSGVPETDEEEAKEEEKEEEAATASAGHRQQSRHVKGCN